MKDFQARVYTDDAETVAAGFDDRGVLMGAGVRLCLTSVLESPGMLGEGLILSVNVTFDETARPDTAANFLYKKLGGDNNAIVMVYDEATCTVAEVEALLRREADRPEAGSAKPTAKGLTDRP